ncbi:MAG TPA: NAD-dependent epimerase/dehydratase family protein [Acidimicrobiia bacterium]|nr:NAD-dependent epimerase/dehydratase family protein [Acidimicrobiia bacterium]
MPDVFLTGGSGWLGGGVLRRLLADGYGVRALARSDEAARIVSAAGAEPVRGDVTEAGSWTDALRDCSVVFHVAGKVSMCDPGQLAVNLAGTRTVMEAAGRAGVPRVVFTSSAATIGEARGEVGTESTPHPGRYLSAYARSKHEAEQLAFSEGRRLGIEVVSVNPSSVQGPGRTHGSARIFIGYLQGRLRWAVKTRLPLVSIDDAAAAHVLAATRGEPGERYLISGWHPTVEEAIALLGEIGAVEHPVRYLPWWALATGATAVEGLWRLVGKEPPYCRAMAREVRHGHVFDTTKSERELGLAYTPPREWLAETVEWYRAQGVV